MSEHAPCIFETPPDTKENPLLITGKFVEYCKPRIRDLMTLEFAEWSSRMIERGLLRPAYAEGDTCCYATYQVWPVYSLVTRNHCMDTRPAWFDEFDSLVRLFGSIQDYYLPLVRSNQRTGETRNYSGGQVVLGALGFHFRRTAKYGVDSLRAWKQGLIDDGSFDASATLAQSGLTATNLREWIQRLMSDAEAIDPIASWYALVRLVSYEKRQKLRYESLLAQDLLEMAEMLRLFHGDASDEPVVADILDWKEGSPSTPPAETWRQRRYGDSSSRPFELLEYVVNEYDLNPKPRAIIFTEGEEWQALGRLYEQVGAHPAHAGIELRSISGEGNFSVSNWQCFIEYMHEKQVLVYFVVDQEGRAAQTARRLLGKDRLFSFPGLSKVIPTEDRLCVWPSSFEESSFTEPEIIDALAQQGICIPSRDLHAARDGSKALISSLAARLDLHIDKPRLCKDLVEALIEWRIRNPDEAKRRVELFVESSASLILRNYQPTHPELRRRNLEGGLLG